MRLAALLLVGLLPLPAAAQTSPDEARVAEWIASHGDQSIALLERTVNINSGTTNHEGVREVGTILGVELAELGFTVRWVDMSAVERAGHLFAEREGRPGSPRVLLIGHLDTVFDKSHPFQRFVRNGDRATGPGVHDMKGGDVVIVTALRALAAAGALDGLSVTVALIGDEESAGLPVATSRAHVIAAGQQADLALGFEPGEAGSAVVARRGSSNWRVEATGREGHSSGVFGETLGSGAIYEIARILHEFHDEVRGPKTLTFNPGVLLGGTEVRYDTNEKRGSAAGRTNVVARSAVVEGDLRFLTEEEKESAREEMREIVAAHLPGTTAEITFEDKYPAMPPTEGNQRLLERYSDVSEDLGHGTVAAFDPGSRGAADISFVAPHVDGIDGLGPEGGGAHSPNEWVDVPSLVTAAQRAAILLHRLASPEGALDVPSPELPDADLATQILHHALPDHQTCRGTSGFVVTGRSSCFMLLYSWRGPAPAPGVRLSLGLPETATLTGASRPPAERTASGARWDLGDLDPGTVGQILLQVQVAPDLEDGRTLRLDAYIQSEAEEEATANNGSWAVVQVATP